MSTNPFTTLPVDQRIPMVTSGEDADAARSVRFDRPLVEQPGWADPRIGRHVAEAARAARAQGLAAGYAAGWAQGRRAAAEREVAELAERAAREEAGRRAHATRVQGMLAALAQTARTLADQVVPAWDGLMETLLEGAAGIAQAVLARELAAVDAEVLQAARTALHLLPPSQALALHVNPADLELFAASDDAELTGLQLVPDGAVAAGSVVARTPLHSLPVDLHAALRAAEEVIRP